MAKRQNKSKKAEFIGIIREEISALFGEIKRNKGKIKRQKGRKGDFIGSIRDYKGLSGRISLPYSVK